MFACVQPVTNKDPLGRFQTGSKRQTLLCKCGGANDESWPTQLILTLSRVRILAAGHVLGCGSISLMFARTLGLEPEFLTQTASWVPWAGDVTLLSNTVSQIE